MKPQRLIVFIFSLGLLGCSDTKDYFLAEKDLIPEGTSYNPDEELLYIGSIYHQKILSLDKQGKTSVVVPKSHFGKFSPLGIAYDPGTKKLWACMAMAPIVNKGQVARWETTIMSFDPQNGQPLKAYQRLSADKPMLLNDLTITDDGTVYVTESINKRIYEISPEGDSLRVFFELENETFPNGITHRREDLFIATDQGIAKVNIRSKASQLLTAAPGVDATLIDGLEIHEDYFIGHQSSKVMKFYFDPSISMLTESEVLDNRKELDSSTTGVVADGDYYFIVNSQLHSGIDQSTKTVKPLDSLETVIIRKIRL
ncbi:MAG: hypothetical protein Tsb0034_12640 [Ekhidna sp.]